MFGFQIYHFFIYIRHSYPHKHFLAEAEILSKCCHPFVVGLYGSFIEGPMFCIVMQYAEGGSLGQDILQRKQCNPRKYFDERQITAYFTQVILYKYLHWIFDDLYFRLPWHWSIYITKM